MTMRNNENSCPGAWFGSAGAAAGAAPRPRAPPRGTPRGTPVASGNGPVVVTTVVFAYVWPADTARLTYRGVA